MIARLNLFRIFFLEFKSQILFDIFFVGLLLCAEAVNPAQALKSSEETQHSFKGGVQKICGPSTGKSYTTLRPLHPGLGRFATTNC